ncbi:bifunctional YncE family protein/alkaline phosphatase family protein [Mucilaginibacter gotjawali]|uniref:YVTN family beta-propeller protein n=2 Tax=Mucilaginibacter gotjawali TaxID=1550579 RepID=A0A839SKG7_9SPHI|nr:bifunctional YncE family protein/alkaline phosphatase family protein [Mucilaginibacter gotjawali]MBB3058376.1 YVTN family beta-propeller protein [Mucilaginibacter gotjawali]BAU53798.1 Phosphoesterase family protein [Mucilaginibacter gotjawali]
MKTNPFSALGAVLLAACIVACSPAKKNGLSGDQEQTNMHSAYDDSTLTNKILPVMMPYNRLIDPAGKVVRFGDPKVENHSLDVKLIPQTTVLAVEDRYGITLIDTTQNKVIAKWTYTDDKQYKGLMSTYSGIKTWTTGTETQIFWSAANGDNHQSYVMQAVWEGKKISIKNAFAFKPAAPSPLALPNELLIRTENYKDYLYVVLNGNNQIVKINLSTNNTVWTKPTGVAPYGIAPVGNQLFITNWGGPMPTDTAGKETAGVPYGSTYTDPKTGATATGSVQVIDPATGDMVKEIAVGLHPNVIIPSKDGRFLYVANANSDNVSVISVAALQVVENIPVRLIPGQKGYIGDSPNALAINAYGTTLYVANGLDNAVAVIKLGANSSVKGSGKTTIKGFIPTEAYPGGLLVDGNTLFVTNLEGEGSRVSTKEFKAKDVPADVTAYNSHHELATVSIIPIPGQALLKQYTDKVKALNLTFREEIAQLVPRKNITPKPIPERIGEPSVFKHVLYIIKENRTYDQVLGDMTQGNGAPSLCIYGDSITPNQHQLAKNFLLLDNYYASGKCSAEGHQWTDAAMVTDYVEKNVRAWFRSYPHVQEDALVYDANGFIWNNAADHGKTVRIYGEASKPNYDESLTWSNIYANYQAGLPFKFYNTSTISRVRPILSQNYPGSDELKITDQIRASAFIKELKEYEQKPGDELPELMVMALSLDHTEGTRPGFPKPEAMVADNDLALGRIIEAVTKSKFWKNTVIFVTEDDSQAGWDHVSAYRTTGFVVSPYSRLQKTVSTNYNQTCVVRSIEQILGIPPMNIIDATALPMFNCFTDQPSNFTYQAVPNHIALDQINPKLAVLNGKALYFARASLRPEFDHVDGGKDDLLNRILWYAAKGKQAYPARLTGKDDD